MDDFIIKEINKDYARYLVIGISAESPLFLLKEIMEQIDILSGDKVLFDQLLQTGNVENRFLALTFDGNDFDFNSAKNMDISIVDNETRSQVADFLRLNSTLLKYSILLQRQKELILSGGII